MTNIAIVSSADSKYFPLLEDLVNSILKFDGSKNIKICIIDGGLTKEQLNILSRKVYTIKNLKHDLKNINKNDLNKPNFIGLVGRLYLRETFPEFDKYIWIDSDAWVNSWTAIEYLVQASSKNRLAVVATADRHNEKVLTFKWLFFSIGLMKSQNYKHAISSGYSKKIAKNIALKPHCNAGVFALDKESLFWDHWLKEFKFAIKKGRFFGSDQIAMNICIYEKKLEAELLPHFCNWIPSFTNTLWDKKKNTYVEKYYPNNPIGIMHLAGGLKINNEDIRFNKKNKTYILTTCNDKVLKNFRYSID